MHLVTVGRIDATNHCYWSCSCGVRSLRNDLTWSKANAGALAHEERATRIPPHEVVALYTAVKWVFVITALCLPLYVDIRFGTRAMFWTLAGEVATLSACVLDHIQSLVDKRAERFDAEDAPGSPSTY